MRGLRGEKEAISLVFPGADIIEHCAFIFATVSIHNITLSALQFVRSPDPTSSTLKMEFDLGGRFEIPCFQELNQPARLRTALKKDCLDLHEDWMRLTLQKVMGSGWIYAGFVNPDIETRYTYYTHSGARGYMGTIDMSAAYLSARAQIFDAIPRSIIQEMENQGYDFIGWDRERRDLGHLLMVVHNFMIDVVNVSVR